MTNNKEARKHRSQVIDQILSGSSSVERSQIAAKMQLAARLDDLLASKKWSKSEFAAMLKKSPSEITKWLSGTQNFTIDTLVEIAAAFDLSLNQLFAEREPQVVYDINFVLSSNNHRQTPWKEGQRTARPLRLPGNQTTKLIDRQFSVSSPNPAK